LVKKLTTFPGRKEHRGVKDQSVVNAKTDLWGIIGRDCVKMKRR